ncbi:MAG: SCP2 sterol-binding domain-containing protein [Candidatus Methanoplasma sp.]|jgi:putative sterol carrier protein|nr:SCP2 sterol-binding domain-containing protein [Candidatus Methanoplasma sp.]
MSMEAPIQILIDKFHRKMEKDEQARKDVMPLRKTINIDLSTEHYSMKLENARIEDFKSHMMDDADITLMSTPENLQGLIDGTLRPMKAYITKKITIKGKVQDLMFLKKFF